MPASDAAARLRELVASGSLDLPLPGGGGTWSRWRALADLGAQDLSLAKLAEAHADACAILAELGHSAPGPGELWAVWAAEPPWTSLAAAQRDGGWVLEGRKPFCSGAAVVTHALVTAPHGDERRLFAVELAAPGVQVDATSWATPAMAAAATADVLMTQTPARAVGGDRAYLDRPGFWHGGIGVAACWYGGARAVAGTLLEAARGRDLDLTALAHLGAVDVALHGARSALHQAAAEVDADPQDRAGSARLRAERVRALVAAVVDDVVGHVGRALGAAPLSLDGPHAQRVADLQLYVRQHHAERDLAGLGGLLARGAEAAW